jgi:hypothetical protein
MTGKRNQRELLWFQTGGALNFITAAPHCGGLTGWLCYSERDRPVDSKVTRSNPRSGVGGNFMGFTFKSLSNSNISKLNKK